MSRCTQQPPPAWPGFSSEGPRSGDRSVFLSTQDVFPESPTLTQTAFTRLLEWLDDGVDSHGAKYLEMRRRRSRILIGRIAWPRTNFPTQTRRSIASVNARAHRRNSHQPAGAMLHVSRDSSCSRISARTPARRPRRATDQPALQASITAIVERDSGRRSRTAARSARMLPPGIAA